MKNASQERTPYEALASQVQLRELLLIESASRVEPENLVDGEAQVVIDPPQFFGQFVDDGATLVCGVKLELRLGGTSEPFFKVNAEYHIVYTVPKGRNFQPDDATFFAGRNAVFNVWPFFRELVWSLAGRAGLPRLLTPLYRMPAIL